MFSSYTCQQNHHHIALNYLSSYPLKTEDGCSFYSDNKDALVQKKYLLAITDQHKAYIQTGKGKFIYFSRSNRGKGQNGYNETYKGDKGWFSLFINVIKPVSSHKTFRDGILTLYVNKKHLKIPVYGLSEEIDGYNR